MSTRAELLAGRPLEDYRTGPDDRYDLHVPWLPYIGMPDYVADSRGDQVMSRASPFLILVLGSGFVQLLAAAWCTG